MSLALGRAAHTSLAWFDFIDASSRLIAPFNEMLLCTSSRFGLRAVFRRRRARWSPALHHLEYFYKTDSKDCVSLFNKRSASHT